MGLTSENYVDEAERVIKTLIEKDRSGSCLLYTSPSPRDRQMKRRE